MKKLFLLPLLTLTLMGCSKNQATSGEYQKVDKGRNLVVCIGDIERVNYYSDQYYLLEYQAISGDAFTINVKYQTKVENPIKIDTYCGKTISYVIGG